MIIYKITNLKNDKFYIGKTTRNVKIRFKEHCNGKEKTKMPISFAIQKYGKENFSIEIIYSTDNLNDLNLKEEYFINLLKPQYNVATGGQGGNLFEGKKHKEASKQLIRESRIGKKDSPETIEKKKNARIGKKQSLSTIQKKIEKQSKEYFFLNEKDENIVIKNLNEYCRKNKLSSSAMRGVYFGQRKTHKGYKRGIE